jgi:O-antigen ligase
MPLFLDSLLKPKNYFSLLLSLIPVSFIAGNLIINLNILLLIISVFLIFKKQVFNIKYFWFDKLLIFYFFFILYTAFYNDYLFYFQGLEWKGYFTTIVKSIFFFRYLLFYFILRFLIEKKIINFKSFFISCTVASLFVSFDIFYQFTFGNDIFGFETIGSGRKLGGPFDDELIAGSFIQRFSIFSFFIIPLFYSNNLNLISKYLIPILFLVFFIGIILSGNRMPAILFIFVCFLILIFNKQTRKFLIPFIFTFLVFFAIIINLNYEVKTNFKSFYNQINKIILIVINKDFKNKNSPKHLQEFETFYDTWLMNKYIGGGIKNFRYYCHVRPNIDKDKKFICNMHPHNYYLEILTETGLIGFLIIVTIFFLILYQTLFKKYFINSNIKFNNAIIPFIFLFVTEIFPIKSTGSFFTTGNAAYLFLIMGLLVGLLSRDYSIEKSN